VNAHKKGIFSPLKGVPGYAIVHEVKNPKKHKGLGEFCRLCAALAVGMNIEFE
jgi:hypothetical protein